MMSQNKIRFIDSSYNELFTINDGDSIRIIKSSGESLVRECRYIDDYHTEIGGHVYHICEFAERMEQNGNNYEPAKAKERSRDDGR